MNTGGIRWFWLSIKITKVRSKTVLYQDRSDSNELERLLEEVTNSRYVMLLIENEPYNYKAISPFI